MTGRVTFEIPPDAERGRCRGCGAAIAWIVTDKGRRMPVNLEEWRPTDGTSVRGESHFATCPDAKRFRKKDRQRAAGSK